MRTYPTYGDNIFDLIVIVGLTLKGAGWPADKRNGVMKEIMATKSYDDAVEACRKFITIKNED